MRKRVKRLWSLVDRQLNAMLITSPENVRYLSGFSGTEGSLLISRTGGFFFTDGRYTTQAKKEVNGFRVITFREKWRELKRMLNKMKASTLGVEARHLTLSLQDDLKKECPSINIIPYAQELDRLRTIKDAGEMRLLKKAARIAGGSLAETLPLIRPGIMELDIAVELEYRMRAKGGSAAAFQTIVASGYRSALPHGVASRKKIRPGELLTIDYGVVYEGYCSDETCTFVVGNPTKKQKEIYSIVKQAHDRAIRAVRAGKAFKDIDAAARRYIKNRGYNKYFSHGTGHGIGLCVHEPPAVSFRSHESVGKGMVLTIEPGIYLPGWGGVRIEDTVIAAVDSCEVITKTEKNLQSVGL